MVNSLKEKIKACSKDDLIKISNRLLTGIVKTLNENSHLADGDNCTLIELKKALIRAKEIAEK